MLFVALGLTNAARGGIEIRGFPHESLAGTEEVDLAEMLYDWTLGGRKKVQKKNLNSKP